MIVIERIMMTASVIEAITVIAVFLIRPFRYWLLGTKKKKEEEQKVLEERKKEDEKRDEALRCSLRDIITKFYYGHEEKKRLRQYEYENIQRVYDAYKALNGNSFVDKIWSEMSSWDIAT